STSSGPMTSSTPRSPSRASLAIARSPARTLPSSLVTTGPGLPRSTGRWRSCTRMSQSSFRRDGGAKPVHSSPFSGETCWPDRVVTEAALEQREGFGGDPADVGGEAAEVVVGQDAAAHVIDQRAVDPH